MIFFLICVVAGYLINDALAVTVSCASNKEVDGRYQDQVVTWSESTVTSSEAVAEVIRSASSGDTFKPGITRVYERFRDSQGCQVCQFTITVTPGECQSGQTYINGEGGCFRLTNYRYRYSSANDVCRTYYRGELASIHSVEAHEFVKSLSSGNDYIFIGLLYSHSQNNWVWYDGTPIDYTAYGPNWNTNEYSGVEECGIMDSNYGYDWETTDCNWRCRGLCKQPAFPAPQMSNCPGNILTNTSPGTATAVVTWSNPTVSSPSGSPSPLTSSHQSGDTFPIGMTIVTISSSNDIGSSYCTFVVYVLDNEPPVFVDCPSGDVEFDIPGGEATYNYTSADPTATDNDQVGTILCRGDACQGDALGPGTYNMLFTAKDPARCNANTHCTFNLIIRDVEDPVITCRDITQSTDNGQNYAVVSWSDPDNSDNVAVSGVECVPATGSQIAIGDTVVECTVTDTSGNTDTCSFNIHIEDTEAPQNTFCPSTITASLEVDNPWAIVEFDPTFEDNSNHVTISGSHASGDQFYLGVTTVDITATDEAGNNVTCTFDVEIDDVTAPVFTNCSSGIEENTNHGLPTAVVTWGVIEAVDNSAVIPTLNDTRTGDTFGIGNHFIALSSTDGSGNVNLCQFSITVIDEEDPVFTYCPPDILTVTEPGLPSASVNWSEPIVTDNSGVAPEVTKTMTSGDVFVIGSQIVTYTAIDSSGNSKICEFNVTVQDNEPPEFQNCPSDIEGEAVETADFTHVNWIVPTSSDNSGITPTITSNFDPGDEFFIGDTDVVYTSTDWATNYNTCEFTITILDITSPVFINCSPDIIAYSDPGEATTVVTWDRLNATDNSGQMPIVSDQEFVSTVLEIGENEISFIAEDAAGNTEICQFNVTVIDDEPPVIHNCPDNRTVSTDHRSPLATVFWDQLIATDNSGSLPTLFHSHRSGDKFAIGYHEGNITAVDASENTIICFFHILVIDNEAPVFQNCPSNIIIDTEYRSPSSRVNWTNIVTTDNSGHTPTVSTNHEPGEVFHLGQSKVVYTAIDAALNAENCSFSISVIDSEKPYFTYCPSDISASTDDGLYTAIVNWTQPVALDNSLTAPTITSNRNPEDVFPFSTTRVIYRATDDAGNTEICQFEIDVVDDEPPFFINMTNDIDIFIDSTQTNSSAQWDEPMAADNSMMEPTISSTFNSGDIFSIGVTTVVYTAVDPSGNQKQFTFTVRIRVAFNNLQLILNGSSNGEKLHVSAIASSLAVSRPLSTDEINDLAAVITEIANDRTFESDRSVEQITQDVVTVTNTVLINKKEIGSQIDMIVATESLMQQVVSSKANITLVRPTTHVVTSITSVEESKWSVHFAKNENALDATRDNEGEGYESDKCFAKLDRTSISHISESATIVATYYDRDVIVETTSETIKIEKSNDQGLDVSYQLTSGLLSYSVATNSSTYSIAVEFSMEIDDIRISSDANYFRENALCVFWEVNKRVWSTTGCKHMGIINKHVKCRCDHTTTFGIFTPVEKPEEVDGFDYARLGERLGIYSVCLMSIVALIFVMKFIHTTWGLFRGPEIVFIYSNLLLSMLCVMIMFVVNSETIDYPMYCNIFGVLLHFFYMAALLWLTVECIYLFMRAYHYSVPGSVSKRVGYALFAWSGALVIAALFFGVHHGYGKSEGCWLKFEAGGLLAFLFPSMTLLLARMVLLFLLSIRKVKGLKRAEEIKSHVRHCVQGSLFLVPQLILTWAFVILADKEYIYWLMFYILFSLNGVTVSLYCYFSKDVKDVRDQMKFASILKYEKRHSVASTMNSTVTDANIQLQSPRLSIIEIENSITSSQAELIEPHDENEEIEDVSETKLMEDDNEERDTIHETQDSDSDTESSSSSSSSEEEDNDDEDDEDDDQTEEEKDDKPESDVEEENDVSSDDHDSDDNMFR